MVDAGLAILILLLVLAGFRRGLFREVLGTGALVVATWVGFSKAPELAPHAASRLGLSADLGYAASFGGLWIAIYLAIQIAGRWLIAKLTTGPREERDLGDAAQGAFASLVRTLDRLAGGALGAVKGLLICTVLLYAGEDLDVPVLSDQLDGSQAAAIYHDVLPEVAERVPEVKLARNFGKVRRIARVMRRHPDRFERLEQHPELRKAGAYEPLHALFEDEALRRAVAARDLEQVLKNEKLIALLKERETRVRLAEVDVDQVLRDLRRPAPPLWMFPMPGEGPAAPDGFAVQPGDEMDGLVREATEEGLFITFGPDLSGLIRTVDLTWTVLPVTPDKLFVAGEKVRAVVLAVDAEHGRASLSRRALEDDPFEDPASVAKDYPNRAEVRAKVVKLSPYGPLLALSDRGLEAVVPGAEIADTKRAEMRVGDTVDVRITAIDVQKRLLEVRFRGAERRVPPQ